MPNTAMISVVDLKKEFNGQQVLRGISLEVAAGETLVIIGRSGGGKSVLLKHLVGLLTPTSGQVRIDGQALTGLTERELLVIRKNVGMMFQSGALFDSMTVQENVAFPLREAGERDVALIRRKVDEALSVVDLSGHEDKMPVNLSGGMKKRVALARVIINHPSCILYDEPTAGLDPVVSDQIDHLIRRLQKRFGVTSIVITHDMKSAAYIADKIAYIHEGAIYFYGTPAELMASTDPLIEDFVHGRSHETDD